jgi:putative restriction endonuclease
MTNVETDVASHRAWLAMAFEDSTSPYSDQAGVHYDYDSNVQNHKQVKRGDLLFVRSRTRLQGIGRIGRIQVSMGEKIVARCPVCGQTVPMGGRTSREPGRCKKGHQFNQPKLTPMPVTKFRAHFDGDWITIEHPVSAVELKRFHLRKSSQLAIMPVALDEIVSFVGGWEGQVSNARLLSWLRNFGILNHQDSDDGPDLTPDGADYRASARRIIRLRRGQRPFRLALLARYGNRCVISNCRVVDILEAAHIRPYRGSGDNHASNGMLLRSDLHTLFDLDLIGIDPEEGQVSVSGKLSGTEYECFHGQRLLIEHSLFPDRDALHARWVEFRALEIRRDSMLTAVFLS